MCFIVKKQAALFLHEVGEVVYFDSKYSSLGDLVILDPQYLSGNHSCHLIIIAEDLMKTIISFKPSFAHNGFLPRSVLPQIWKQYDPADHPAISSLLTQFSIIHPITLDDGQQGFFVPWCANSFMFHEINIFKAYYQIKPPNIQMFGLPLQ